MAVRYCYAFWSTLTIAVIKRGMTSQRYIVNNLQEQIAIMIFKIATDKLNKCIDLPIISHCLARDIDLWSFIIWYFLLILSIKSSTVYSLINDNNHNRQEMMYLEVVVIVYRRSLIKLSLPILLRNAVNEQITKYRYFPMRNLISWVIK